MLSQEKNIFPNPVNPKETAIMNHTNIEERLQKINLEIAAMKAAIQGLESLRKDYPALDRNLVRIGASIKMLELNFVDPAEMQ